MSEENVDKLRAAFEALSRGDLEGVVADLASDFEYIPSGAIPDTEDSYRGSEEFKRFLRGWLSEFDDARLEPDEFIDAGDLVVVSTTWRARGKASGAETSWNVWLVWRFAKGKAVRGQGFTSKVEALEAAGLKE